MELHDISRSGCSLGRNPPELARVNTTKSKLFLSPSTWTSHISIEKNNFKYESIGHGTELGHHINQQETADGSPESSGSPAGTSPSANCEIVRCGTPAVTSVAHTPSESSWNVSRNSPKFVKG